MRTLVLSGGSIAGIRQVAWLTRLAEQGYRPEAIVGTSVGALNAAYLAEQMGLGLSFASAVLELKAFWLGDPTRSPIQGPEALVKPRSKPTIALHIALARFNGLLDSGPLRELIDRTLVGHYRNCPIPTYAVSVNARTGEILRHAWAGDQFRTGVLASASEPIIFPPVQLEDQILWDGGHREIVPVPSAIALGASEITALVCQPTPREPARIRPGNFWDLVGAFIHWVTWETGENDLARTREINTHLVGTATSSGRIRRGVPLRVIRPRTPLPFSIERFTKADLVRLYTADYDSFEQCDGGVEIPEAPAPDPGPELERLRTELEAAQADARIKAANLEIARKETGRFDRGRREQDLRAFAGYLSGFLPELHRLEVPRVVEAVDAYLRSNPGLRLDQDGPF